MVTDFRHLNTRIAKKKNNITYPLVKDTFATLRNSKCKVLSVLDLKDAFHSDCQKSPRNIVAYYHILVVLHTCIRECLWDLMFTLQYGKVI